MRRDDLLLALLAVALCVAGLHTTAAAQEEEPADPATLARDLAAVKAFRALVASHSYQLPDSRIHTIVLEYLQKDEAVGPKQMPTAEQLEGAVDLDFESLWDDMINEATTGLDPDGELKLTDRLRAYLGRHKQWRAQSEGRYDEYLNKQLPKALARAESRIVAEQKATLSDALAGVIATGTPDQQAIYKADDGDNGAVAKQIVAKVLEAVSAENRRTLLIKSHDDLEGNVAHIVRDGVSQLGEQLQSFDTRPMAISQRGIEGELRAKLTALAVHQKAIRKTSRLGRSYGPFTRASEAVPERAGRWFDALVAERVAALAQEGLDPSQQDINALTKSILADVLNHHERATSWLLLQPSVARMVEAHRSRVTEPLESAFRNSASEHDSGYPADRFRQDLRTALDTDGTRAHDTWAKFAAALTARYKDNTVPEIRVRIAREQASELSPTLASGRWLPSEAQLTRPDRRLDRAALIEVGPWKDRPPQRTDVLDETWELWTARASEAFGVGRAAIEGQRHLVNEMKPTMRSRILRGPDRKQAEWVQAYAAAVTLWWKQDGEDAAKAYPELFAGTREHIAGIVAMLVTDLAKERELARQQEAPWERAQADGREEADPQAGDQGGPTTNEEHANNLPPQSGDNTQNRQDQDSQGERSDAESQTTDRSTPSSRSGAGANEGSEGAADTASDQAQGAGAQQAQGERSGSEQESGDLEAKYEIPENAQPNMQAPIGHAAVLAGYRGRSSPDAFELLIVDPGDNLAGGRGRHIWEPKPTVKPTQWRNSLVIELGGKLAQVYAIIHTSPIPWDVTSRPPPEEYANRRIPDLSQHAAPGWHYYCAPTSAADVVYLFSARYPGLLRPFLEGSTGHRDAVATALIAGPNAPPPGQGTLARHMRTTPSSGTRGVDMVVGLDVFLETYSSESKTKWETRYIEFKGMGRDAIVETMCTHVSQGEGVILLCHFLADSSPGSPEDAESGPGIDTVPPPRSSEEPADGGHGIDGPGGGPPGYIIPYWLIFLVVLLLASAWYLNLRYLRASLAARRNR